MTKYSVFAISYLLTVTSGCQPSTTSTAAPQKSATTAATASVSSPGKQAIELVPKVSFGPIRLGASKADVEGLGILKEHPSYSAMTAPYTVGYDAAGKAQRIQLSLKHAAADVTLGTLTIPRDATFREVKALLGDCKDRPPARGGTGSDCRGGLVGVSIGSAAPKEVWLEIAAP